MVSLNNLQFSNLNLIEIYTDASNLDEIVKFKKNSLIRGFTTNPSLLKNGGVKNYIDFISKAAEVAYPLPISIEVISDDSKEIYTQALKIASISENINVKIPIMNTKKESNINLIKDLLNKDLFINITAIMTKSQLQEIRAIMSPEYKLIISVFAGRIADTGVDPIPIIKEFANSIHEYNQTKLLWASPRELLNVLHAIQADCDIITATPSVLNKLNLIEKNLEDYSRETVQMFYDDGISANFKI